MMFSSREIVSKIVSLFLHHEKSIIDGHHFGHRLQSLFLSPERVSIQNDGRQMMQRQTLTIILWVTTFFS